MNPAYLSVLSALAGTLIGGLTSFLTSYVMLGIQARQARLAAERGKREELYGGFMTELAIIMADALNATGMDYAKLSSVFGLKGRIMLIASPPVVASADENLKFIMDLYLSRARTGEEVRAMMDDSSSDPIGHFARACRAEMRELGLG
ncbi:MAG: hypothetical protein ABR970_16080 [Roseiarcus sp.]|jgi:hypothetical protein